MNKLKIHINILVILAVLLAGGFMLVHWQISLMQVRADDWPVVVNTNHLDFGVSFPGEERTGEFTVTYADNGLAIPYKIIQKLKPFPPGHPDYPGFYKDLCPFLSKVSLEGEGDVEGVTGTASVSPTDTQDTWTVQFSVPAIFGSVAQDHEGGIVTESGEYGCDISIDIDLPECQPGAVLFTIGDIESGQMDNPVDELNFQGLGILPPFDDPFVVGSSSNSKFPWNSNYTKNYADDFDINFDFYSLVDAAVRLELGWGPGRSGTEQKQVFVDSANAGASPVRTGASVAGWWEDMERFQDNFTFVISPGNHTINLRQLSGNGTIWDYARLVVVECDN